MEENTKILVKAGIIYPDSESIFLCHIILQYGLV
jgi:hypothetical protein